MSRMHVLVAVLATLAATSAAALEVRIVDAGGTPLVGAMATWTPENMPPLGTDDDGYPQRDVDHPTVARTTVFSDADGKATLDVAAPGRLRVRLPEYIDVEVAVGVARTTTTVTLAPYDDPRMAAWARPSNAWTAALSEQIGDPDMARRFRFQCGFCHQQGSAAIRVPRDEATWHEINTRMVGYGARMPSSDQKVMPALLSQGWAKLLADPSLIPLATPHGPDLHGFRVETWPAGDGFSQMHDSLAHPNGSIYVGDNIQDRLWEFDPAAGIFRIHVLPHDPDDRIGGMIAARLAAFPRHVDYVALHSLAEDPADGHLFMTPSNVRRIIEFAPASGEFTVHRLPGGMYPHTIRADGRGRLWFTLALSNQIGMLDRRSGETRLFDLPSRNWRETITLWAMPLLFRLAADWGLPLSKFPIDMISSGVPLPYGLDVAPDGTVWFTRMHAGDIGRIDAETLELELIPAPVTGPRRIRVDGAGHPWFTAFPESELVRLDRVTRRFERFELPVEPVGSETPYALGMDRRRGVVWVTGTNSDTLMAFEIVGQRWHVVPLPDRMTFTRDIDIAPDGSAWASNGAFPAWHVEDGQPDLIRVVPPWAKTGP